MAGSAVSSSENKGLLSKAWRTLCSVRLTAVLLFSVIVILLLGTLFPQRTVQTQVDEAAYAEWMTRVLDRYGRLGEVYRFLGLFHVYDSAPFLLLLGGLLANGIACTLDRLRPVCRSIAARPGAARPDSFYEKAANRAKLKVSSMAESRKKIVPLFSRHRYRLLTEEHDGVTYISGRKNVFAEVGTLISHGALILVAVGALISGRYSWRQPAIILGPGQVYDVGHGHDFQVRHEGFQIDRWPQGQPRDYRSQLVILERGSEVTRKTIRVNDPLNYEGVTLYLRSSGPAVRVSASDSQGHPLPMETAPGGRATGGEAVLNFARAEDEDSIYLPSLDVTLYVSLHRESMTEEGAGASILFLKAVQKGREEPIYSGRLLQGEVVQISGASLSFTADRYSELQAVSDPGFIPVIGGGFLGLAGLVLSFYFCPCTVWVKLTGTELLLAGSARRHQSRFEADFAKLVTKLGQELQ